MALEEFIQTAKITQLMVEMIQKKTVFNSITRVTKNFTGSSSLIPVYSGGTLRDYAGGTLTVDIADSTAVEVFLDQRKYMNSLIDGVQDAMAAQKVMPQVLNDMTNKLTTAQDVYVLSKIATEAGITGATLGVTAAPIQVSTTDELKAYLRAWVVAFDKADVSDRYLVIPPETNGLLLELVGFSNNQSMNNDAMGYGFVTNIYGIDIYVSKNLPAGAAGERKVVGGSKLAADTLFGFDKMKTGDGGIMYEGEFVRGIAVYGAGANNPALLGVGFIEE